MKRYFIGALLFAAMITLAIFAMFPITAGLTEPSPQLVLRYADDQPAGHPTTKAAEFFAEQVSNKTGGRIKIQICNNAELGDEKSVVEQVSFGGIDFARVSLTAVQDLVPSAIALQMPYTYRDAAHMWDVLDGAIGDQFLAKLEQSNIVGLTWYDAGARSFYASKPIRCFLDMQNLRIRIGDDDIMRAYVQQIGAVPKVTVYSDVMPCLQAGVIDAAENSLISYQSMGHYRPAPYFLKTEHLRIPDIQIVSQNTWNQISPEDQALIRSCAKESSQYQRALWRARESAAESELERMGCTIVSLGEAELEKFRQQADILYDTLPVEYRAIALRIRNMRDD